MLTKITLTIDGQEMELDPDCVKNWDDVLCTYKRSEFSGVVRQFTSKFEFVNDAYDMLLEAFMAHEYKTSASVAIYVIDNDWHYNKEFEAPLDFSTLVLDNGIATIGCIDNGLAALIKARKSTKYEFVIGEDIAAQEILQYDRLIMQNSCAHEITGDETASYGAVLLKHNTTLKRVPTYSLNSEVFENSPVLYEDQTEDAGSAFITAVRAVPKLKIRIEIWSNSTGEGITMAEAVEIRLKQFTGNDANMVDKGVVYSYQGTQYSTGHSTRWDMASRTCVGTFGSLEALKRAYPNPPQDVWAMIAKGPALADVTDVYFTPVSNKQSLVQWEKGSFSFGHEHRGGPITSIVFIQKKYVMEFDFQNLGSGQKFALFYKANLHLSDETGRTKYFPIYSKITASWESRAKTIEIPAISPTAMLTSLFGKICDNKFNVIPQISNFDPRLAKTYLLAAESIRNIAGAKIYSSFNDFCDWIETVFGYTYYLGEAQPSRFVAKSQYDNIGRLPLAFGAGDGSCPDANAAEISYYPELQKFLIFNTHDGLEYSRWRGSELYNDPETGLARKDVLFVQNNFVGKNFYIGEDWMLVAYDGDPEKYLAPTQEVHFVHRNELFTMEDVGTVMDDVNDVTYKTNSNVLYSIVEIGYEKQDYETECGRDEWNFMNYYNTGIDIIEKKLTLQSKYRADCYGLEFLAQERAKDSTDNKSDNTIFFVYCKVKEDEEYVEDAESRGDDATAATQTTRSLELDRSTHIEGALSDSVFNGEFSPYHCLKANEGYISAMGNDITLQFASSDGNSDIVIDGIKMTSDVPLTQRLFTAGELTFTTIFLDDLVVDFDKLITVRHRGMTYKGYLKEAEICYAHQGASQYQLIINDIEI